MNHIQDFEEIARHQASQPMTPSLIDRMLTSNPIVWVMIVVTFVTAASITFLITR